MVPLCQLPRQQFAGFATTTTILCGVRRRTNPQCTGPYKPYMDDGNFMWDGGITHLDLQPLAPLTVQGRMGETLESNA